MNQKKRALWTTVQGARSPGTGNMLWRGKPASHIFSLGTSEQMRLRRFADLFRHNFVVIS